MTERHTFRCEKCGGTFNSPLSDEEAREQFDREFPDQDWVDGQMAEVCDDCFHEIMARARSAWQWGNDQIV